MLKRPAPAGRFSFRALNIQNLVKTGIFRALTGKKL